MCVAYRVLTPNLVLWLTSRPSQEMLSLQGVSARINHPCIAPPHLHFPHDCNTIARQLRNIPHLPFCMPYTIHYWEWQYGCISMQRYWSSLLRYCPRDFFCWLPIFVDIQLLHPSAHLGNRTRSTVESRVGLKKGFGLTAGKLLTLKSDLLLPQGGGSPAQKLPRITPEINSVKPPR